MCIRDRRRVHGDRKNLSVNCKMDMLMAAAHRQAMMLGEDPARFAHHPERRASVKRQRGIGQELVNELAQKEKQLHYERVTKTTRQNSISRGGFPPNAMGNHTSNPMGNHPHGPFGPQMPFAPPPVGLLPPPFLPGTPITFPPNVAPMLPPRMAPRRPKRQQQHHHHQQPQQQQGVNPAMIEKSILISTERAFQCLTKLSNGLTQSINVMDEAAWNAAKEYKLWQDETGESPVTTSKMGPDGLKRVEEGSERIKETLVDLERIMLEAISNNEKNSFLQ
eukprot:TRINITY_DN6308_c0_g1_i5.p1 TRINITY_DN6308_c0_g1~~TRINITY_DN6308_c0_g1_i5.p1  ORF type:complete len:278 (-),score=54.86 TRINITY_DN6308_c0_g1_i5:286-1119(-)